ncbi:2-oxoglutarate ferredoxin oxidoreductase subunit alpha [Anaerosolibacter carboniphilus]|uniref:2-oxoglutarate ferredoxin oxidoreductase subunit alpha n=1 Tax=Anaerosolibacter carboniphilus TaxID=1417629 RepID=A0A841KSZ0_9FIRM|nr:2-oxoacid:acceptor oxidoreductase subunit alpha [Anaerosolibacter carboniphilus]MBB6214022.1 2-oxoglutarate ferredoxin oxidoreductase subunit alpha [Anaerosolibacter carboniphilus]
MAKKITLMLGGIQGEGIVSVGDTLIRALSQAGYYAFGYRTFSSRIKGGHSNYVIDIHRHKILSCEDSLDILIAADQESIKINLPKLKKGGLLIYDDIISVKEILASIDPSSYTILPIPFTTIAKQYGNTIMKNTGIIGFLGQLFHVPLESIANVVLKNFKRKGEEIVANNMKVLTACYELPLQHHSISQQYTLEPAQDNEKRASMIGNEAIGFGALMAGCRFMAAYPITPSSEIMEYLTKKFPSYNGIMIQTEDEISAITMTMGAAYGGVRSMTATSGPGISLMMEGIGLAGMTETPVVIIDVQRGGPSTGLPTKHEQSDIDFLYYGAHGEIPTIIVSPYTVEECFYQTIWAFNLAEQYQCPVFILSDLHLGLSRQTIDTLDSSKIQINRGKLLKSEELAETNLPFKRFAFTADGISPRAVPGQPFGMHHITGIEHMEAGKPFEGSENRKKMMDKRLDKLQGLKDLEHIDLYGQLESDLLVLSIGSNYGMIRRVVEEGQHPVAYGMFKMIKPMPVKQLEALCSKYKKILVIEGNATGQLASIIKKEVGFHDKIESLLKYDGTPFKYEEIHNKIKELI